MSDIVVSFVVLFSATLVLIAAVYFALIIKKKESAN